MKPDGFTIRVYGLHLNDKGELLLTDEYRLGQRMTKFPGGGLQIGEGPEDCLRRECWEEMGEEVEITDHFYTTGFYQPTYLLPEPKQLISIYYRIEIPRPYNFRISELPFDYGEDIEGAQSFRFESLNSLELPDLTFPVDRFVLERLKEIIES